MNNNLDVKAKEDLPSPVKYKKPFTFTRKSQIINRLGVKVKVKGEGKNCQLAECVMRRRVSA